jgi:hypothetical protein
MDNNNKQHMEALIFLVTQEIQYLKDQLKAKEAELSSSIKLDNQKPSNQPQQPKPKEFRTYGTR